MAWFPLQWVAQNSRRFNSILLNIIYFLEIALNASAAPFLNSYVGCRVNVLRDEVLRLYRVTHVTFSIVYQAQLRLMSS